MHKLKSLFGIAALLFFISGQILGQLRFNISTDQEYSDNPFMSPVPISSLQSTFNFNTEVQLNTFKIGYYGSYSSFDKIPDRNYYWHQTALFFELNRSEFGVYAEQRINKTEAAYFDYGNITAFYRTMFNIKDYYISLNTNFNYTKYENISILDNYKGSFNFRINHSAEWGTTFIAGGGVNYKYYVNPNSSADITYLNEDGTTDIETVDINNTESLTQLVSYARIAQPIFPTTGLAVQFTNRKILTSIAEEVKDVNIVFGDESEMFDDPVTYSGNTFSVELTQILLENMVVKAGYYFLKKHYPTQGIYDEAFLYDTEFMRNDEQNVFNISISKKFVLEFLNDTVLSLGLYYRNVSNKSNSYWFNYDSNSYSVSLGFQF